MKGTCHLVLPHFKLLLIASRTHRNHRVGLYTLQMRSASGFHAKASMQRNDNPPGQ